MNGRVGFLSTFPPAQCGIAAYTADLVAALRRAVPWQRRDEPLVLGERLRAPSASAVEDAGLVRRLYARDEDYVESVVRAVREERLGLLHIQHSPDLHGTDDRVLRLCAALRAASVRSLVTMHTVHTWPSALIERRPRALWFQRALGQAADMLIVHGEAGAATLASQGVPRDRVTIIPHGTATLGLPDAGLAKARLGCERDDVVLLYFGFIHMQKNVHTIVRAFGRLPPRLARVRLVIAGSVQNPAWYNRAYEKTLRLLVRASGASSRVLMRIGFVPDDDVPWLYGAADLVLLPYAQRYNSASGVLHKALGAHRPVLCSDSPKFVEVASHIDPRLIVPTHDVDAWADRIAWLADDADARRAISARVAAHARQTSWATVARAHAQLYERLAPSFAKVLPAGMQTSQPSLLESRRAEHARHG